MGADHTVTNNGSQLLYIGDNTNWVQGTSKGFFKSSRGIRQGDPLYPFFFSLVADGLSAIIENAELENLVEGTIIGDDSLMVSHLQFVDDTILFLKEDFDNVRQMELCMKIFEAISSLKVNLFMSYIVDINVEENFVTNLPDIMGCSVGRWPINYLGMPLGGNPKSVAFWDPVVEKVSKKMAT